MWSRLVDTAPEALGLTVDGNIVSSYLYVTGEIPDQEKVDEYLELFGLQPVKKNCWLWKKTYPDFEMWIGDARNDNFVDTGGRNRPDRHQIVDQ